MKNLYGRLAQEPVWTPAARFGQGRVGAALRQWLFDPGSLTRRLRLLCPGRLAVTLLGHGYRRPMLCEARVLGCRRERWGLIREVQLHCDGEPWVFARTVIPRSSLRGDLRRLARLGERPLGEVLFADPRMRRGPVEVAPVPARGLPVDDPGAASVWGRRSVFRIAGKPLLVSEFFLPALLQRIGEGDAEG